MSSRTTRVKLKHQAEKAIADIDRALGHLHYMSEINDGRHPVINAQLPLLAQMLVNTLKVFNQFKANL